MELDKRKSAVIDDDGNEIGVTVLFTYHHDERNKDYVVFVEDGDEENAIAMILNDDNSVEEIIDDDEFEEVLEVYDAYFEGLEEEDEE